MDLADSFNGFDSISSDSEGSLSSVEFGEAGRWELLKRSAKAVKQGKVKFGKGKVFAAWSIDALGEFNAASITCGFFAKKKGRVKILKDANCDKNYNRRSDKIISTGRGPKYEINDFLSGVSIPGYGFIELKGFSSTKKTNKEKESSLNYEFLVGGMGAGEPLIVPISPTYMKEFNFSNASGMTVDLFEEMHAERSSL